MATKQLTAKVRLNSTQAEQKLKNIAKAIDIINKAASRQGATYHQVNAALGKTVSTSNKVKTKTDQNTQSTKKWANALSGVNSKLNTSSNTLGMIGGKIKRLASTYLGVMGMNAIIGTSDMITSAENKLNYINSGDTNLTQDAMNKMYASSQKVRMGYGDMMSNVSKSMALAGDAFDNNTDKAIRFQEIMAEAYAVGGASAQEMSSSMYQLIQALGSGTLAGDELRSVREGAPLAYKEIEKFAQKVYDSEDSLKDMASQGLITADMVTAAIMGSGEAMDKAFAETEQTFGQTWEQIKNAAIYAFKPISKMLREELNNAIDSGLIQKVETAFSNVAKGIMIAFQVIKNTITWIADNWGWIQHIVVGGLILMASMWLYQAGCAVVACITTLIELGKVAWTIIIVMAMVLALAYVFYLFKSGAISLCEAIAYGFLIIASALLIIGIMFNITWMWIAALIIAGLALIFMFFEEVCYWAARFAGWIVNGVFGIVNFICACLMVILAFFYNLLADIGNGVMGIWNVIKAITKNIGIAFQNAWIWAKNTFWEFIADVIDGISKLEPVINGIAKLIGKEGVDFGGLSETIRKKKGEYKEYVDISAAWSSGWNTFDRMSYGDAWNTGLNTLEYVDPSAWGETAGNWGAGVKDSINQWGSQFQNQGEKGNFLDNLGNKLGLDFGDLNGGFPTEGVGNVGSDFDPSKALGNIDDNTGKMADSMDLTSEDVEYLRKIAGMEWKKETTIADIKVDMSNYNTINSDRDLDGIVTKLTEKLYEELNEVADGVYAY